ncbi:MAG: tRNA (adenosine(37)-N6)-threonylcarbamoyltransferase complex transferase subunit TsaD [Kiritimatiellia bacterium]
MMKILGIETSCDETAAAVLEAPLRVCSSVVASQIAKHGPYGGVVPEIACREHVQALPLVLAQAVQEGGSGWADLDAIAVTYAPGLAGALLTGLSAAQALHMRLGIPLFAVNHLHGHLFSPFLDPSAPHPDTVYPFLALVVSGGHTCLVRVDGPGIYGLLGTTVDDAAGEAFDKGANLLGLGYPGGHRIDALAKDGDSKAVRFPRGIVKPGSGLTGEMDVRCCFSFSGVKTALRYHLVEKPLAAGDTQRLADLAASYQAAIVDALVKRVVYALECWGFRSLAVGGGVSLNAGLRVALVEVAASRGIRLLLTPPTYCGDNAAMIAAVAGLGAANIVRDVSGLDVDPSPEVLF